MKIKFFFYGIFLDQHTRDNMGIYGTAVYDTVLDYATYGNHIVTAHHQPGLGLSLSGVVVDVPLTVLPELDELEEGYKRVTIKTVGGREVQMYRA